MDAVGIILSNINDRTAPELTYDRTLSAMHYGGKYRLIDFVLSSLVNSAVAEVAIVTKANYHSLMNHIGTGKEWDLSRKMGGIIVLPSYVYSARNPMYNNRLEALMGIEKYLFGCNEEYVILSDGDTVFNIDYDQVLKQHLQTGADITAVYQKTTIDDSVKATQTVFKLDENNRVTDIRVFAAPKNENVGLNTWFMRRAYLLNLVTDAVAHGYRSFTREVLGPNIHEIKVIGYEYEGYFACMDSVESYFAKSMELLIPEVREKLFENPEKPIFTSVKDSPPTKYGDNACIKNSIVADGCIIEGTVENSILFRGVYVGKGTEVQNSIIMEDSICGENSSLNYIVADKNVILRNECRLSGQHTHPFYIKKGSVV